MPLIEAPQVQLRTLIEGDNMTFVIIGGATEQIDVLKARIHEHACHGVLQNVDSKDLVLYEVRNVFSLVITPLLTSCA